jgi:hypothetical protein
MEMLSFKPGELVKLGPHLLYDAYYEGQIKINNETVQQIYQCNLTEADSLINQVVLYIDVYVLKQQGRCQDKDYIHKILFHNKTYHIFDNSFYINKGEDHKKNLQKVKFEEYED